MRLKPLVRLTPAKVRFILNVLGGVILIAGLSSAACIWLAPDQLDGQRGAKDTTGPLSPEDSRRYTHDVELYYGETGLLADKFRRWLEGLTHGKGLAETVGVGSLVLAAGCFCVSAAYRRAQRRRFYRPFAR